MMGMLIDSECETNMAVESKSRMIGRPVTPLVAVGSVAEVSRLVELEVA